MIKTEGVKLYEISTKYRNLLADVDEYAAEHEGEIPAELDARLTAVDDTLEIKAENIGCYIKNLRAESDAIAGEIKRLSERKRTIDSKESWLGEYLQIHLPIGKKISTPSVVISWRKSERVKIFDESSLPETAYAIKREVSRTQIRNLIESGSGCPGAEIEIRQNLQIK